MTRAKPITATSETSKRANLLRRRILRLSLLPIVLLAIGCLAGCMSFSPTRQTVSEALGWQKVAEQLRRTDNANLSNDLNKILRTVRHSGSVKVFRQLAQTVNDKSNGKSWLIGRAHLFAGVAYISAAQIALTNRKTKDARNFCLSAAENFVKASQHLPSWERKSVLRWASQLRKIADKLDAEPFYALTHLKALSVKAKMHASFIPPNVEGR